MPKSTKTTNDTKDKNAAKTTNRHNNKPARPSWNSLTCNGSNFGAPASDTDEANLRILSAHFLIVARPPALPLPGKRAYALPSNLTSNAVFLNSSYDGPGTPRFAMVCNRTVVKASTIEALLPAIRGLDEAVLRSCGFGQQLSQVMSLDRSVWDWYRVIMPQAVAALSRLSDLGHTSTLLPPNSALPPEGARDPPVALATSLAVSRGWGTTTFENDSPELYSFVVPLCSAVMNFGDLGRLRLKTGDLVALLAGVVPHSLELQPMPGEEGFALVSWTEDRVLRLIEYDAWLHGTE